MMKESCKNNQCIKYARHSILLILYAHKDLKVTLSSTLERTFYKNSILLCFSKTSPIVPNVIM